MRATKANPVRAEVKELAAAFRKLHSPLDDAGVALVAKVVEFVFQRIGGLAAIDQHKLISQHRGDVAAAAEEIPPDRRPNATQALTTITRGETPYLTYVEDWKASRRSNKTTDQYHRSVCRFAATVDPVLERLDGPQVQAWIDHLLRAGQSPATVQHRMAGNRDYWQWMQSYDYVPADRQPFTGRRVRHQ